MGFPIPYPTVSFEMEFKCMSCHSRGTQDLHCVLLRDEFPILAVASDQSTVGSVRRLLHLRAGTRIGYGDELLVSVTHIPDERK
jgi:hypothetical protein